MEQEAPDPVLQLQSHADHPPPARPDGALPARDQTQTPRIQHTQPPAPADASGQQPAHQQLPEPSPQHPPPSAPHRDASATPVDPARGPMSQHPTPVLPPMQFQQQQPRPPSPGPLPAPAHAQNGAPPHKVHAAQNTNGTPVQYASHPHAHAPPPPNYAYPPEAAMQQAAPNGAPVNGYGPPHMGYPMALGGPHMNTNQLPGARHKKEIKRRTKTGCLTCRKRRIKCDEGHPTCRNCQKSKRECLGYDPIFKSQTSPQTIQPAPGNIAPPPPLVKQEAQPAPDPPRYSNVPQGYMPAASAGYSPAAAMQPPIDYGAAIDPALAPPPPPLPPPPQEEYTTTLRPQRNVRLVSVEALFTLDDVPPSLPPARDMTATLPPHEIDMIRNMYIAEYAAGLDRFLETAWYTDHGFNLLLGNPDLLHYFAYCVERFRQAQNGGNPRGLTSLEARLIWQLACLPRSVHPNPPPPHHLVLLRRLDTIQHLLCATFMDPSLVPVSPPPTKPELAEQYAQYLQDAFWHQLGRFVSIHDDVNSHDSAQQIANSLAAMRNILSMLENRDVLYSMAIARHFGGRMVDFYTDKTLVSRSAEPDDPIAKLAVAMNFIRDEDSQGTTQVVQRLCGMCRRSWVLQRQAPGNP